MKISIISSAIVGIVFGIMSNTSILLGSYVNLLVWAIVGILIGLFIEQKKYITWSGLTYGFFLSVAFFISGFKGSPDKIPAFTLLVIVFSIIGAFAGWLTVVVGNTAKRKLFK